MRTGFILAAGLALAAGGCSAGADKGKATAAVAEFRQLADAGRFADIWRAGAAELKASTSEAELVRVLGGLQLHYGNFRSASETNWRLEFEQRQRPGDARICERVRAARSANERFVYRIENGAARLVGYNRSAADGRPPRARQAEAQCQQRSYGEAWVNGQRVTRHWIVG